MKIEKAIFACGCFWGVQHQMERAKGVIRSTVGYTGGKEQHPTYQEVKAHTTRACRSCISGIRCGADHLQGIMQTFLRDTRPGTDRRTSPDIGPQYRSEIFYLNEAQKAEAEAIIQLLREKGYEVNTRLTPASEFWPAEDYHQHYYDKTGGEPYCHIRVKKF